MILSQERDSIANAEAAAPEELCELTRSIFQLAIRDGCAVLHDQGSFVWISSRVGAGVHLRPPTSDGKRLSLCVDPERPWTDPWRLCVAGTTNLAVEGRHSAERRRCA